MNQFNDPYQDALRRALESLTNPKPSSPPAPTPLQDARLRALQSLTNPQPPKPAVPIRFAPPKTVRIVKAKPKVFVSFDYENDVHYKRLLEAWDANKKFQFIFQDLTPQEIQSSSVARVKAVLTSKIKEASHTLVIIGQYANQFHKDRWLIGCRNWVNFEIQQSILHKKKIVGVRIQPHYLLPEKILGSGGRHVEGFTEAGIVQALQVV